MLENRAIWAEWNENFSKLRHEAVGGYILEFDVFLKEINKDIFQKNDVGKALIQITDESWIPNKGVFSLAEHIHWDYNAELNWNEPKTSEYLEDAILSSKYGRKNGVYGTVAVLHKIEIFPENRGQGFFIPFMETILDTLQKWKVDFVILQPHPFGSHVKDLKSEIERLRNFYRRFGFEDIPIRKGNPYMKLYLKQYSKRLEEKVQ